MRFPWLLRWAEKQRTQELGLRLHRVQVGAWQTRNNRLTRIATEAEAEAARGAIIEDIEDRTGEAPLVWDSCPLDPEVLHEAM